MGISDKVVIHRIRKIWCLMNSIKNMRKEKLTGTNKRFLELTNQHTTLNESFYQVKKDLNLLQNEMDSFRRLRDQLQRD